MDIHQLKTFVTVAREGSITRASELLHLSQPAVSAHIKAIEDALGLALFERTPRGMSLTREGQRLLARAEQTLAAHHELMAEATRIKGRLTGKLRLGAGSNSNHEAVGRLLTSLSERCPDVEVALKHGTSLEILARHPQRQPRRRLLQRRLASPIRISRPSRCPASERTSRPPRGSSQLPSRWTGGLSQICPWIYPAASACCGRTAEALFKAHRIRPADHQRRSRGRHADPDRRRDRRRPAAREHRKEGPGPRRGRAPLRVPHADTRAVRAPGEPRAGPLVVRGHIDPVRRLEIVAGGHQALHGRAPVKTRTHASIRTPPSC
jgi:DNA-binding transcriptional LysR family regulator